MRQIDVQPVPPDGAVDYTDVVDFLEEVAANERRRCVLEVELAMIEYPDAAAQSALRGVVHRLACMPETTVTVGALAA